MTKIRCKTDSQMDWEELASKYLVETETQYKAARTVQYLKKISENNLNTNFKT